MVKKCLVCQISWNSHDNRSFHKFPRDSWLKQLWLKNLLITEEDLQKSKMAFICSDHFSVSDRYRSTDGKSMLKFNAIPKLRAEASPVVPTTPISSAPEKCVIESGTGEEFQIISDTTDTASEISLSQEQVRKRKMQKCLSSNVAETSSERSSKNSPTKRRKCIGAPRYFGDCHTSDLSSPNKAKRNWQIAKRTISKQRRKIVALHRQNRRLKYRICSLSSLLTYLREKEYISPSAESVIEATLPGQAAEVVKRILKGPTHEQYSPLLRTFALTLHFYSPKAYNFVRATFNSSLPHPRTISKWYSTIEGKPGFTEEALRAIKAKILITPRKKICVNLVLDEIHIMKKVEWAGKELVGYINLGAKIDSDCIPEATQALVFMVVAMNDVWKIPVGYFFIESLTGLEKSNLVIECLKILSQVDVKVTSITFDGAAANMTMMRALGANFENPASLRTYFMHPVTNEQIYLFLDPCHMLKLVRNVLGSTNILTDYSNSIISWNYLEKLVEIQEGEGLSAGTKLKRRHLKWIQEKMRVKIAAQTLSRSVSDALLYLEKDAKVAEFFGAEATAQFVLLFNNLFDIFNSKNFYAKYKFKRPISERNWQEICEYLNHATNYILSLKIRNEPVVNSGRKTGFLGFLICIESLKCLFWDSVFLNSNLSFICTYKLSQDHLEIFFSAIRSRCGSNNNPTCRLFEACYKKLLIHTEVKGTATANAIALDGTSILDCSSSLTKTFTGEDLEHSDEYFKFSNALRDHDYLSSSAYHLTDYVQDVVSYIAGFVVRSLSKKITCKHCMRILEDSNTLSMLQIRKTYGKLRRASRFVIDVCKQAEICLRTLAATECHNILQQNIALKLRNTAMRYMPDGVCDVFNDHISDFEPLKDHSVPLIKMILDKYINIRIHHELAKKQAADERPRIRNLLTKSITFRNQ